MYLNDIFEIIESLTDDQFDYLVESIRDDSNVRGGSNRITGSPRATAAELRMHDRRDAGTPAQKRKEMIARLRQADRDTGHA